MLNDDAPDLPRGTWQHICRIVHVHARRLYSGTAVLVSDRGGEFGYALTCWHNFDERFSLDIKDDETLRNAWLIPAWAKVGDEAAGRPVTVVGRWSNKWQDIAVLKVPRSVIEEFRLRPFPVSRDLRRGMRLSVIGFQRPGTLLDPDHVEVTVVDVDKTFVDQSTGRTRRVFEVRRENVPWDKGMSGGAIFERADGALMGLAAELHPDEDSVDKYAGIGIPIRSVMEAWPTMAEHCVVVTPKRFVRRPRWVTLAVVLVATLAAAIAGYIATRSGERPGVEPPRRPAGSTSAADTPVAQPGAGKPVEATTREFSVQERYVPSGKMGDVEDVTISAGEGGVDRFTYVATGRPPHEWDQKYVNGTLNTAPAKFGGVMYLSPPNAWGTSADCGYDLRGFRTLRWEARSPSGEATVEFVAGGVNWTWAERDGRWEKVTPPFPDSLPGLRLGTKRLTADWQTFEFPLPEQAEAALRRVVGGFGWVMTWASNDVEPNDDNTGAREPRTFVIETRNVVYAR